MKVAASWGCCRIRAAVLVVVSLVESCRRLERDGSGPVAADAGREMVDVFAS
jgi:hypothetical protein